MFYDSFNLALFRQKILFLNINVAKYVFFSKHQDKEKKIKDLKVNYKNIFISCESYNQSLLL